MVSLEHRVHERCACGSVLSSKAWLERGDTSNNFVMRGTERVYERPRPFRIEHIALDLEIDHASATLSGTAELTIERVDADAEAVDLDAVAFSVGAVEIRALSGSRAKRARAGFRRAEHVYDDETLRVAIPAAVKRAVVRVRYSAKPRRGMYFLAPDEIVVDRPRQVWTQCQDEDARHIFPCHDKPHIRQTMDIAVAVEPGWFVLSNGELLGGRRLRQTGRFHYRMTDAIPSYLFTVVAGSFAKIADRVGKLPVDYYVPKGRETDGKRTFVNTPAMIRLFADKTGVAYPWTKYAQVVVSDFIFGGMENTGATTLYEHVLLDERAAIDISSDDLIAHELAHQWFGDLVTCRDWSHAWLNEGFATFFEHVWREHHLGSDEYHYGLRFDLQAYLSEASGRYERPVVCQDYDAPIDIFDRHLYEKGALFLHALRRRLGDAVFWRGIHRYLERHARGVVETRDLLRAMEEVSGQSLEQQFEQGLYRASHPKLDVHVTWEAGSLAIAVKQTVASGDKPFVFDLEIDVARSGKRIPERLQRRVDKQGQTFAVSLVERPRFVVVDPELTIVGRVNVTVPADMARRQLAEAPSARGRALAADTLSKRDDPTTVRALSATLGNGREFWGVRAAAAQALGNIRTTDAFEALSLATGARHPKVRRAVAAALGAFKNDASLKALARLAKNDRSVLVAAAACRALGETRRPQAFDLLTGLLGRPSWADVLDAGAISGLAQLRDERALAPLKEHTRYGAPNRARRAAIAALPMLSTNRKTRELLEDLLDDGDPYLRTMVAEALGEIGDPKSRPALTRQLGRDLDGRVRRRLREVLRDLGGKGRREMSRLREALDELGRKHAELAGRFSKLEETSAAAAKRAAKKRKRR